ALEGFVLAGHARGFLHGGIHHRTAAGRSSRSDHLSDCSADLKSALHLFDTARPARYLRAPSGTAMSTATDIDDPFLAQLRGFVGRGVDQPGFDAPAAVSEAVIRQMVHAVGDRNPIYTDAAAARATLHGAVVAPPL